jgi:hypothetical protein
MVGAGDYNISSRNDTVKRAAGEVGPDVRKHSF